MALLQVCSSGNATDVYSEGAWFESRTGIPIKPRVYGQRKALQRLADMLGQVSPFAASNEIKYMNK
jgi:hypothetical protein